MGRPKIQRQTIDVPLTSGLGQKEDPKYLPLGQAATLQGFGKVKQSTLEKPHGFDPLPNVANCGGQNVNVGVIQALGTNRESLVIVAFPDGTEGPQKNLFQLSATTEKLTLIDKAPECYVPNPRVMGAFDLPVADMDSVTQSSISLTDVLTLSVFAIDVSGVGTSDPTQANYRVYWGLIDTISKSYIVPPREVLSLAAINNGAGGGFIAPKVILCGTTAVLVAGEVGTTNIYGTTFDLSAPTSAWSAAVVLTSNVYTNFWLNHSPTGVFDIAPDENDATTFVLGYQLNVIGVNSISISSFAVSGLTPIQAGVITDAFWTTTHGLGSLFGTGANGGSPLSGLTVRASSSSLELKAWIAYAWHWYQSGTGASISQSGNTSTITGLTGLTAGQTGFIALDGSVHANNNFGGQGPTTTTALGGQPFVATGAGTVTVTIVGSPIVTDAGPLDYRISVTTSPAPTPVPVIPNFPKSYVRAAAMNLPGLTTTTCTPVDLTNGMPTTYPGPQLLDIKNVGTIAGHANTELVVWSPPNVSVGYNPLYVLAPAASHAPPLCAIFQSNFYSASGTGTLHANQPRWTNNVTLASRMMVSGFNDQVWVVGWLPSNNLSPTGSGVANVTNPATTNVPYAPYVTVSGGTLGVGVAQLGAQGAVTVDGSVAGVQVMFPSANVANNNYSNASNNGATSFASNFTANVVNVVILNPGSGYTSAPAVQLNWGSGASLDVTYAPGFNTSSGAVNQGVSSIAPALANGISGTLHNASGSTVVMSGLARKSLAGAGNTVSGLVGLFPEVIGQKLNIGNAANANNNGDYLITGFVNGTGATVTNNNVQASSANNYSVVFEVDGLSGIVASMVGEIITLSGSDVPGNNRRWTIANVLSSTSLTVGTTSLPAFTNPQAPTANSVTPNNVSWIISSAVLTRSDGKSFTNDANAGHLTWQVDNNNGAGAGYNYQAPSTVPIWLVDLDPDHPQTYTNVAVAQVVASGGSQGHINQVIITDPNTLANISFPWGAYAYVPAPNVSVASVSFASGVAGAQQVTTASQLADSSPTQNIQGTYYLFSIDTFNDVTTPNDTGTPYRNVPMRWIATLKPRLALSNFFSTAKSLPHFAFTIGDDLDHDFMGLLPINVSPTVVGPTIFELGIYQDSVHPDTQSTELGGLSAFGTGLPFLTDGSTASEVAFPYFPENILAFALPFVNQGDIAPDSTVQYIAHYQRRDAAGNVHRSGRSVPVTVVTLPINDTTWDYQVALALPTMGFSYSQHGVSALTAAGTPQVPITIQLFRTIAGGTVFFSVTPNPDGVASNDLWSPYVLITSTSPPVLRPQVPYVIDDQLLTNPTLYGDGSNGTDQGSILDNLTPPAFQGLVSHKNRLWGIDGPNLWFSKAYTSGEGPGFNEQFALSIDDGSFPITALATMDERLIIFKRDRIFYLIGDGPADNGGNNDIQPPQRVVSAVGCIDFRSVVVCPLGVWFNSDDGLYLLTRKMEVQPAGKFVEDIQKTYPIITASALDPSNGLVMWNASTSNFAQDDSILIAYDYTLDCWSSYLLPFGSVGLEVTAMAVTDVPGATQDYNRALVLGTIGEASIGTGPLWIRSAANYFALGVTGGIGAYEKGIWEGPWIRGASVQDFNRYLEVLVAWEGLDPCQLKVEIGYNFSDTYTDVFTVSWAAMQAATSAKLQWAFQPTNPKAESMRIRVTDLEDRITSPVTGQGARLWGVTVMLGLKDGVMRLPVAQRGSR